MKDELYKKVFIHSVEDLPKEGRYIIYHKEDGLREFSRYLTVISTKLWMEFVDYYLQPIEQLQSEKPVMTEEEIDIVDMFKKDV